MQVKDVPKMKNKLLFNNTYKSGVVSYVALPEKNKYLGVCLQFDLIIEADTLKEAQEHIVDLSRGWLENAIKNKLSEEVLNRPAPKKYWKLYEKLKEAEELLRKKQTYPKIAGVGSVRSYTPQFPLNFA